MVNFRLSRKICICLVIVLIFSQCVFAISVSSDINAQASYTRIGQFNQYITNNYGNETSDVDTSLLIGMYQSLVKLAAPGVAYGIDRINHTYYLTGTLTYLQEYLMQITENQYDIYKTEDTYLNGLSGAVSDIKTYSQNTAAATNAALTLMGDIQNINWISAPWQFQYYTTPSGFQPSLDTAYSYQDYPRLYVRFGSGTLVGQNVFKVAIPVTAASNDNRNNFIDHVALYRDNVLLTDDFIDYYYSPELQQIYLYFKSIPSYGFNIAIFFKNNWILRSGTPSIEYIPYDTMDYYLVSYLGVLNEIAEKDFTAEIDGTDINVNINDSVNVTPIELDVSIGIDDFTAVNTVSNKLRTWLTTGVSVSALIGALDALDDSFFTLSNRNTIETLNNQYTDFYD